MLDRIDSLFPDSGQAVMLIMPTLDSHRHNSVLSHLTLLRLKTRKTDMYLHDAMGAGSVVNSAATLPVMMIAHRHHPVALTGTIGVDHRLHPHNPDGIKTRNGPTLLPFNGTTLVGFAETSDVDRGFIIMKVDRPCKQSLNPCRNASRETGPGLGRRATGARFNLPDPHLTRQR